MVDQKSHACQPFEAGGGTGWNVIWAGLFPPKGSFDSLGVLKSRCTQEKYFYKDAQTP